MIHVHVYVCRNEAFLQLRMAVRVLRVAVRVLGVALYFNSTVTFFLFLLRGLGGTPFEVLGSVHTSACLRSLSPRLCNEALQDRN
jgi:hypothetical protein